MPRTVLVVDDHPSFRRLARKLLDAAGYVVVGDAADGASAVAAVRALRPDVVLLDVLLPDQTGFDVAEKLAAEAERPVVVLTSSRTAAELARPVETEYACGFLSKQDLTAASLTALLGDAQ